MNLKHEKRLKFLCKREWEALDPTGDSGVKYCDQCERNVYKVETYEALDQLARDGKCAAFYPDDESIAHMAVGKLESAPYFSNQIEPTPVTGPDTRLHNPDPDYLRSLIERIGVSQRQIAKSLGVSESQFRAYLLHPDRKTRRVCPYLLQYALEQWAASVRQTDSSS